jgi:hypothetical protein
MSIECHFFGLRCSCRLFHLIVIISIIIIYLLVTYVFALYPYINFNYSYFMYGYTRSVHQEDLAAIYAWIYVFIRSQLLGVCYYLFDL